MYIIVRNRDKVIIGSASSKVDEKAAIASGYTIYEVENSEFSVDMIGKVLESFEVQND